MKSGSTKNKQENIARARPFENHLQPTVTFPAFWLLAKAFRAALLISEAFRNALQNYSVNSTECLVVQTFLKIALKESHLSCHTSANWIITCRKPISIHLQLLLTTLCPVYCRACRSYWENLQPASGRPYSAALSKQATGWEMTAGHQDMQQHREMTSAKELEEEMRKASANA